MGRLMDRYGFECETKVKIKLVYDRDTGTTDAADIQPGVIWQTLSDEACERLCKMSTIPLDPDFVKTLTENFWELMEE